MSIAWSRLSRSQSVAYGRRYSTVVTRPGWVTSCLLAAPLGHSRPRLTGESGSPSIWVTASLPPAELTYTRWPQPTAQYGHTDRTTRSADSVRGAAASVPGERTAAPRPSRSSPVTCRYTGQAVSFRRATTPSKQVAAERRNATPGGRSPEHARWGLPACRPGE